MQSGSIEHAEVSGSVGSTRNVSARARSPRFTATRCHATRCHATWVLLLLSCCCLPQAAAQQANDDFPPFDALMNRGKKDPGADSSADRSPRPSKPAAPTSNPSGFLPDRASTARQVPPGDNASGGLSTNSLRPISQSRSLPAEPYPAGDPRRSRASQPAERNSPAAVSIPESAASPKFNWSEQIISVADLRFPVPPNSNHPSSKAFEHGQPFLTLAEESAYLDLLDAIATQKRQLLQSTAAELENAAKGTSVWEKAFYQYENARRMAWRNGHLRSSVTADRIGGLPNPFAASVPAKPTADDSFRLLEDIARFPDDYVGRPIVLYGRFSATSMVRIGRDQQVSNTATEPFEDRNRRPDVAVLRGSFKTLNGGEQIATVDTRGLLTPQKGVIPVSQWPAEAASVPVLVKGWVVKKWDQQPLIYCETLREISPIPHLELIQQNTIDKRPLRDEETWLYYETIRQLELNSSRLQREIAANVLQQRILDLMQQVDRKTKADIKAAEARFTAGKLSESQFRQLKSSLLRRLDYRVAHYRKLRKEPSDFQTYVDMFQYPEVYHGHLVTLQGHVRHMVSYPGDDTLFDGRMLHELWLFTDDSQHNPAVIVTPNLPADFPTTAEVIDRVSVTGCFFKRYVYGSQDTDRIAPLLLAKSIEWRPTANQVQALVADGHLSARSARAVRAAALTGTGLSRTAWLMIGFLVVLTLMILWGRSQREERDRIRLRKRVNELPEFENPQPPGYAVSVPDFSADYSAESPTALF